MVEVVDFLQLPRTQKYKYLVEVLEKIETNKLYKDEVIEDNEELEKQRMTDIEYMNNLISEELLKDDIKKMFVKGRMIKPY